jgi:carboxyl-terminal processing protease
MSEQPEQNANSRPENPYNQPAQVPQGEVPAGQFAPVASYPAPPAPAPLKPATTRADYLMPFLAAFRMVVFLLVAFMAGIFFTIFMQTRTLENTPLEVVQRPILDWSGIPANAHKEWLTLQQTFALIDKNFYEPSKINHKEMIYAAAEAAVAALGDRFTAFNRPVIAKANDDHITGRFVGLGVTPEIREGKYYVKRVISNSPIEKAGIKEGDYLVAINGTRLPGVVSDALSISTQLRGEINTKVKLTFARPAENNKETEYELTRQELIAPSVDAYMLPDNLAYIDMRQVFGSNSMNEFDQKVGALAKDNNPNGYILDLRGNGGGLTDTARQLLGRFLDGGIAYYDNIPTQNVNMRPENVIPNPQLKIYDKPLVVLTDSGTASASEITVGALQDRKRATIIGEKTYGKGVAQYVIRLLDNSALRVTFESWFTPNKTNITDTKGIKPDVEVIPTETERKLGQDPQLDRAIQVLTKPN